VDNSDSDSDSDDVNTAHGSSGVGRPRKRTTLLQTGRWTIAAPASEAPSAPALAFSNPWPLETTTVPPSPYPNWPWMQYHQVQPPGLPWIMPSGPPSMQSQVPWMMPSALGSLPYPGVCWPPTAHASIPGGTGGNPDSAARAARRQKRKLNNEVAAERSCVGRKPRQIQVQPGEEIDGACPGKNGWDDAIRGLVPRILDISIVDWEAQKTEAVQKLRDRLDSEFEYLENPLSMQGFRNTVKRYLKSERSRLKMRYRSGDTANPVHVQPAQWERLK
jgi:hypothetical protein